MSKNLPFYACPTGAIDTDDIGEGMVSNSKVRSNAVGATGLKPGALKALSTLGHNGAGAVTATGFKVGDAVVFIEGTTAGTLGDLTSSFESVITVADQIQQSAATDLSAKAVFIVIVPKGTVS